MLAGQVVATKPSCGIWTRVEWCSCPRPRVVVGKTTWESRALENRGLQGSFRGGVGQMDRKLERPQKDHERSCKIMKHNARLIDPQYGHLPHLEVHRYSRRFATRTARTQRLGQRGKRSGRTLPNQSRLGSNLAVAANSGQLAPTWANLRPTGLQHGATCGHFWTQVGLSIRNLVLCGGIWHRSRAQDKPNVGNMAQQSQKTIEIGRKMQVFSVLH